MTDSPTSGMPRPPASDASTTLAELERKLHELERDLTAIGSAARGPADAWPPAPEAPASEAPDTDTGAERTSSSVPRATVSLVDEASPAGDEDPLPPAPPILARDADPALFPGTPALEPPMPDAALASHEPRHGPGEGNREFDAAGRLELLLRFRDQLERSARGLVDDYDRLLAHLPAPARPPAPSLEPGSEPQAPVAAPPAHSPAGRPTGPPEASRPPAASPAPATSPTPAALPAAEPARASSGPMTASGAAEPSFECRVELDAGPFADVESLSSFEQALAAMPHALDARVRRFDGARAAIDLRLALTPTLVQEMHEALAAGFSVVDSGPGHLAIVLDHP